MDCIPVFKCFLLTSPMRLSFWSFGTLKDVLWDSGFFLAQSILPPTNATGLPVLTLCLLCVSAHAQKRAISSDYFSFTQWCMFFIHNQLCGLLPVNMLAACQPHSLKRERWGLSCYGLMPGCVERGVERE